MYLYLAGDIGGYKTPDSLAHGLTWARLNPAPEDRLILLGDNVYPKGVPHPYDKDYAEMATRLRHILDHCLDFFSAPIHLLPGNHDYNRGKTGGVLSWQSQMDLVRTFFNDRVVTVPAAPCKVTVGRMSVILIDTQHYLQPEQAKAESQMRFLQEDLARLLEGSLGRPTLLCGHHPLYSRAMHGGKFSLKQHLFPLTLIGKRLMVPLPGLGTAVAMGRRALGTREDIRHPRYRRLRIALKEVLGRYQGLVYAGGHDHNLQHYSIDGNHFIVSGAASKTAYVRPGGRSDFTAKTLGCFRMGGKGAQAELQAVDFQGHILQSWTIDPLRRA